MSKHILKHQENDQSQEKLLPCPFCGSDAQFFMNGIICSNTNCGAEIIAQEWMTPHPITEDNMIMRWNRRTQPTRKA